MKTIWQTDTVVTNYYCSSVCQMRTEELYSPPPKWNVGCLKQVPL